MRTHIKLSLLFVSLTAIGAAGCSTSTPDEEVADSEAAIVSCGSAKYAEALAHYKNAVAWSKDRLESGVCQSQNGYLWGIADEASRAVMACGAFRETIKTSPWAGALRTVLSETLTYRSLTGELLVIKDSPWQNWTGTETFFAKGTTFWARSEGAYGYPVSVDFRADGKATWGELDYNEATGEITWKTTAATYAITRIDGTDKGKRKVTVKHGAKTDAFVLGVDAGWEYDSAPVFTLVPAAGATAPKLYSLKSECDA